MTEKSAVPSCPVAPEVIERICSARSGNVILGGKRFEEQIAKMLKRRVTRGKAGKPKRTSEQTPQ